MVDLMFERARISPIYDEFKQLLLAITASVQKLVLRLFAHVHCANWQS